MCRERKRESPEGKWSVYLSFVRAITTPNCLTLLSLQCSQALQCLLYYYYYDIILGAFLGAIGRAIGSDPITKAAARGSQKSWREERPSHHGLLHVAEERRRPEPSRAEPQSLGYRCPGNLLAVDDYYYPLADARGQSGITFLSSRCPATDTKQQIVARRGTPQSSHT